MGQAHFRTLVVSMVLNIVSSALANSWRFLVSLNVTQTQCTTKVAFEYLPLLKVESLLIAAFCNSN